MHTVLIWVVFCGIVTISTATIIGAAVIPHGDFALDPSLVNYEGGSVELHRTSLEVGKWITDLQPDIVFLTTPHGIADSKNFLLYANTVGSGSAPLGQDLQNDCHINPKPPYNVPYQGELARQVVLDIIDSLSVEGAPKLNLSSITSLRSVDPIALGWGEIIAIKFFENYGGKLVILSIPSRRTPQIISMIPELRRLGSFFYDYLDNIPQRVMVVVSSDLAHTHLACGPYGYSPTAEPFDRACGRWAATLNSDYLIVEAANIVTEALSCGYSGMVFLDGMLSTPPLGTWSPELLSNEHPTYFGMLVAKFSKVTYTNSTLQ